MGNKAKRIISLVAAATMASSALALAACKAKPYSLKNPLTYTESDVKATSNGGFAVEKDGYVYFINGQALSTASNEYGEVNKASLMRISTIDLNSRKYENAETVIPLLFVSGNANAGIYIHGDYVYFATPTTDKDMYGNVLTGSLDFKRAKLDGTEVMSDYYFRTSSNSVEYRFVKGDNGKIYCMYVDGGALKSYNVTDREETVLVKGAASGFIFDKDQDSDTVYYTMNVPNSFFGTDDAANESYTQIYRVSATAEVTNVDKEHASYTVKDGDKYEKTYDFNEEYFAEKNAEAKEKKKKDDSVTIPYDLSDYTTYGYVNLGELVVDGIGASQGTFAIPNAQTAQFHKAADYSYATSDEHKAEFTELKGYIYTLQSYENGGIYFTRTLVNSTENDPNYLYFLADETTKASAWNTILGNNNFTIVSTNTANASASAIYYLDKGVHTYLYVSGDKLIRESYDAAKKKLNNVEIAKKGFTGRTPLYTIGKYLYTYSSDAKTLHRIDYTGTANDYNLVSGTEEYSDVQILKIEYNTAWYAPEFFGNVLLYNNAQTINGTSYNYITAVNLEGKNGEMMTVAELTAFNEKYDEVIAFIDGLKGDKKLSAAVKAYFYTGKDGVAKVVDELVEEYGDEVLSENDLKEYEAYAQRKLSERKLTSTTQEKNDYTTKFKDEAGNYYDVASYFFATLGNTTEDDENMLNGWKSTIYTTSTTEEEEEGMKWWHWVLIGVGSVAVVVGGVFLAIYLKDRSKKAMEERMRNSKPRKKIDTTDDKTIDVYADEETAEEATSEEVTEEVVEEASEDAVESVEEAEAEPVAEEATVDNAEENE